MKQKSIFFSFFFFFPRIFLLYCALYLGGNSWIRTQGLDIYSVSWQLNSSKICYRFSFFCAHWLLLPWFCPLYELEKWSEPQYSCFFFTVSSRLSQWYTAHISCSRSRYQSTNKFQCTKSSGQEEVYRWFEGVNCRGSRNGKAQNRV